MKKKSGGLLIPPRILFISIVGAVAIVATVVSGWGLGLFGSDTPGRVLGVKTTASSAAALDKDEDGWTDIYDPVIEKNDNDGDGVSNSKDKDADGDGILNTKDFKIGKDGKKQDLSLDQNNNGVNDPIERHQKGLKYDGDGDGKADIIEMLQVAKEQANLKGISFGTADNLAAIPRAVYTALPPGWWNVTYDKDNDGIRDGLDSKIDRPADAYLAYTDRGAWKEESKKLAAQGDCPVCAKTERPKEWEKFDNKKEANSEFQKYREFFGQKTTEYANTSKPLFSGGQYEQYKSSEGSSQYSGTKSSGESSGSYSGGSGSSGSYSGGSGSGGYSGGESGGSGGSYSGGGGDSGGGGYSGGH